MNWIEEVLTQHKELEAPMQFWYWSGLCAISAILKDSVWLDQQLYNVYPNIYVMLHATSGLKKGGPISMANQLVKAVNNTRIIRGRSSIQGILKKLGTAYTLPGGVVVNKANAFICSSELSSSMVEDRAYTNILTDFYDRNWNVGDYESLLKSESFNLRDPIITILGGTNEAHNEELFGKKDIQGGYFARTFIVYADKRNKINSLVRRLENPPDYKKLAEYLKEVNKLRGPFTNLDDTEAGEYYHEWYTKFTTETENVVDETGQLNRFGDSVLKVAMLLSLSRSLELTISLEAMQEAVVQCEKLIGHTRRVTMGKKGRSSFANQKVLIVEKLLARDNHMITRAKLMEDMHYHLNSSELDEVMKGFEEMGHIKGEMHGSTLVYVMPEVVVEKLKAYMEGKNK